MKINSEWFILIRIFIAIFLLQTVIKFKFPGHPDSVYIFTQMGVEPWGRYLVASIETIASILLLIPQTSIYGASLTAGVMLGAIGGYLTKIGINPPVERGLSFFIFSIVIFLLSCLIIYEKREHLLSKKGL